MKRRAEHQRTHRVVAAWVAASTLAWLAPASPVMAAANTHAGAVHAGQARVEARLLAEAASAQPGDTFRVGVLFEMSPGWHIYWKNPGDAGVATSVRLAGKGVRFGPIRWPKPATFQEDELTVYGYSGRVLLFSEATVTETATEAIELSAEIEYVACADVCAPGSATLSRQIPVGAASAASPKTLQQFQESAAMLPTADGADPTPNAAVQPRASSDASTSPPTAAPAPQGLGWVLLLAFFGGMLLNLMPCVFPVLAIKVASFSRLAHARRSHVLGHGLAYTAGVVGSLVVLAGIVVALRAAGGQVGWGFQFQHPIYMAVLTGVVVLFALNLFGLFEVTLQPNSLQQAAASRTGAWRSVWEGILAVALATPCSAPFLGTAVGFALASSAPTILGVFSALGLGLAAPFVLLTLVPGWAKILPKPGPWMEQLKRFLGFALLGTAIWLVWLVGRAGGVDAMARLLMFVGVLGLGAWLFGQVQFRGGSWRKWATVAVAASLVGAAGVAAFPLEAKTDRSCPPSGGPVQWRPWSAAAVRNAVDDGNLVFVDFTADWCLTCKVNERNVLSSEPVVRAFKKHRVVAFKADWSQPDAAIRARLADFGKAGVPMYLLYAPNASTPHILPELLTTDGLLAALAAAREQEPGG